MSAQRLSPRSRRRIERDLNEGVLPGTEQEIIMAWSHGGYVMAFVTAEHKHGLWDKKTGAIEMAGPGSHNRCYSTCPHGELSVEQWADEFRRDER